MKIKLTVKQRITLAKIALSKETEGWLSTTNLGQWIYREDEDNYKHSIERLGFGAFAKIGTDRTRDLLAAGLVERKFVGYLGQFKYRLTDHGRTALEGRDL